MQNIYDKYDNNGGYIRLRKALSRADSHNITGGNTYCLSNVSLSSVEMAVRFIEGRYINSYWEVSELCIQKSAYYLKLVSYDLREIAYITIEQFNDFIINGVMCADMLTEWYSDRQAELLNLQSVVLSESELTTERILAGLCSDIELPHKATGVNWLDSSGYFLNSKYKIVTSYAKGERLNNLYGTSSLQHLLLLCLDCGRLILRSVPYIRNNLLLNKLGSRGCGCFTEDYSVCKTLWLGKKVPNQPNYTIVDIVPLIGCNGECTLSYKLRCSVCGSEKYVSEINSKVKKYCSCVNVHNFENMGSIKSILDNNKSVEETHNTNLFENKKYPLGTIVKTWKIVGYYQDGTTACKCLHCGKVIPRSQESLDARFDINGYSCGCVEDLKKDSIIKYIRKLNNTEGRGIDCSFSHDVITLSFDGKNVSVGTGNCGYFLPGIILPSDKSDYNISDENISNRMCKLGDEFTYLDAIQSLIHEILQRVGFTNYSEVQFLEEEDWSS